TTGGVMCPSYQMTLEEKHSTRGRAHLLWEMLQGEELEVWQSPEALDALDLCLSCKGCTHERPVDVDLPTPKAEFLSHHYARRRQGPVSSRVLFWPDTFTNHFEPEVAIAAVEELEAAGFHVQVPQGRVCCGRPLYDYGFLGLARRYLQRTLAALREEIRTGI